MRLSDLVRIDNRFERSVNLLLDLHNEEKLRLYIPTRSSVNLITTYLREVTGFHGERANILIGPYGKGKSHLLLVLMSILAGKKSISIDELIDRISLVNDRAGKIIEDVHANKKILPVIINTSTGDLSQAFIRSLIKALRREGMDDVVPDSYYSEAARIIKMWEYSYPETYDALKEMITDTDIESLLLGLEQMNHDSLARFRSLYPHLTSGSEFNPGIEDDVITVYRSVNRAICTQYGYDGIYIIFDEFSKYIEGHSEEGFSADMKILQDMCELCNSSVEEQVHLTCVAHKAIRSYGDLLSRSVRNAFRGVEGRLKERRFIVSSQNNYELIADALKKTSSFYSWEKETDFVQMVDESYQVDEFPSLFNKDDYVRIIGEGAFPLTPVAAMILLSICEKIAQNERTVFTFIAEDDVYSLSSFVKRSERPVFAGADLIYDYFSELMETDRSTDIHSEWLIAEHALSQTEDAVERKLIKALAAIRMVNLPDVLPAMDRFLFLALGSEKDSYKKGLERLASSGIIVLKKGTGAYEFQSSAGIDIDNKVSDCVEKYFRNVDIPAVLNDVNRMTYILPKKYNQEFCMTRYFSVQVVKSDVFLALSSVSYLVSQNEPDGYLLLVLCKTTSEIEIVKEHTIELDDPALITCCAILTDDHTDETRMLLACRKLLGDEAFCQENDIILPELRKLENELSSSLALWVTSLFGGVSTVFTKDGDISVGEKGLNRTVSDICSRIYDETPIINHELINRHNISAQVSKARNTIIDDILHFRDPKGYMSGTSAESTIYRAVMAHTANDPNLKRVRAEILSFVHESKGNKVSFSRLFNVLTAPPLGMRRGVIPFFIAEQLTALEDMPVVYQGKREVSIDPQLLANIAASPMEYSLFVEVGTIEKLDYIEGIENLFADHDLYCRDIEKRNRLSKITCVMQAWYRSLPQTSVTYKVPDDGMQDIKMIVRFRKLLADNPNPRELIFEKLPKLCGDIDLSGVLEKVVSIKNAIDMHIHSLKKTAEMIVRKELGLPVQDDFYRCLKTWYEEQPDAVKHSVLTSDNQQIFNTIRDLSVRGSEEIVEKISKATVSFYIEDWRDDTVHEFTEKLDGLVSELEDKSGRDDSGIERLKISDGAASEELFYDFDPENISPTGHFFQSALEDILEEYGDALENSEKIGILMNSIRKLME